MVERNRAITRRGKETRARGVFLRVKDATKTGEEKTGGGEKIYFAAGC